MPARELAAHKVERIWGRHDLPAVFGAASDTPIGEVWFAEESGAEPELLVKYLFTSERLSVQVHPDDEAARSRGFARGKDEAWLVLDAGPSATIGLGMTQDLPPEALRAAALDGSIETLLDWRPVKDGDFFYSTGGTIHAIGAGLSLIEIQQNLDLTYRLYDYGRPRELHLEDAVAVARAEPWSSPFKPYDASPGRQILAADGAFVVERWTFEGRKSVDSPDGQLQIIPVRAGGTLDGASLAAGTVWRIEGGAILDAAEGIDLLAAYPGRELRPLA